MENFDNSDILNAWAADWKAQQYTDAESAVAFVKKILEKVLKKQEEISNLNYEKTLIVRDFVENIKTRIGESYYNIFSIYYSDILHYAFSYFGGKKRE